MNPVGKKLGKLKWAIFHGQRELVDSLLEENASVSDPRLEKDYRPLLHSSVHLGDPDIVRKLLSRGASVNHLDRNDETALMLAAKIEKYSIVDILLSDKSLENCVSRESLTHLHVACMRNRVEVVRKLVENGANINISVSPKSIRWPGYTPLHFAVQFQCIETVAFLLELGADVTMKNSNQLTALHLADMIRNDPLIDLILEAHRKVAVNPINSEGFSHYHIACTRNNTEIVECFIRNGVTLNQSVHKTSFNWPNYTAIDFAIYYDCVDVVKLLLIEGGRKIFPSVYGLDCLYAILDRTDYAYHSGNMELVDLFLQRDKLMKTKTTDVQKLPALHFSCIYNDVESVTEALMDSPAQLNSTIWQGSTPLHLAIERKDEVMIEYLLDQGADYNIKNADGKTSLHLVYERNMIQTVELMLLKLDRIKDNPVDSNGFSHLHIACIVNHTESVARFIELGTDLDKPVNIDSAMWPGFTSLHFAAKFGSIDVVWVLLEHGASYLATEKHGHSAFDLALFGLRDIYQDNFRDVCGIMRAILLSHVKDRNDSFKDRGFSLLHLLFPRPFDDSDDANYPRDLRQFIDENGTDVNKAVHNMNTPWDGYTPLHFAMLDDDSEPAKLLIEKGANILSKATNGDTPMHLSWLHYIMPEIPDENTCIFDELRNNPVGTNGTSIFHVACKAGKREWVEYFLNLGVSANSREKIQDLEFFDKTPLHMATRSPTGSKLQVVELLLQNGADVSIVDRHLNTPLHFMHGSIEHEIIDILVDRGLDVNFRNAFLETPLLSICRDPLLFYTDEELSKKIASLLNNGADINLTDEGNATPLTVKTWRITYSLNHFSSSLRVLLNHVLKLKAAGLHLSRVNDEAYSKLWTRFTEQFKSELSDFMVQCDRELESLTQARMSTYATLRDVLFKDLNGLSLMSENHVFQQMINSDEFETTFPIYGPMLKLQLKRGQERRSLLANAGKVLKSLLKNGIPQEIVERILQFLDNENLKDIFVSDSQTEDQGH